MQDRGRTLSCAAAGQTRRPFINLNVREVYDISWRSPKISLRFSAFFKLHSKVRYLLEYASIFRCSLSINITIIQRTIVALLQLSCSRAISWLVFPARPAPCTLFKPNTPVLTFVRQLLWLGDSTHSRIPVYIPPRTLSHQKRTVYI